VSPLHLFVALVEIHIADSDCSAPQWRGFPEHECSRSIPAVLQLPFSGLTTPKKRNPPYPQRLPDPVTDWTVYDVIGAPVLTVTGFRLNTVYYEKKSELRVTISPQFLAAIPPDSILQMTRVDDGMTDYSCEVFPPGSTQFTELLKACNQTMPSGGKPVARLFGWV
jgi:hypothetical protein